MNSKFSSSIGIRNLFATNTTVLD